MEFQDYERLRQLDIDSLYAVAIAALHIIGEKKAERNDNRRATFSKCPLCCIKFLTGLNPQIWLQRVVIQGNLNVICFVQ